MDKETEVRPSAAPAEIGRVSGGQVSCDVCRREIAASVAVWREGSDYVAHFCGLDCYDQWLNRPRDP